jgi:copper(I)-binding protein
VLVLLAGLALLAGCSAGPAPGYLAPQGDGATGRTGDIVVTDAAFAYSGPVGDPTVYPRAGTAPIVATIVNTGDTADHLLSVSSPIAEGGSVTGDATLPGHHVLAAGPQPGAAVLPDTTSIQLQLTTLTGAVRAGLTYPVVLTFAAAGQVHLDLPVALTDQPRASCPLPPDGHIPKVLTAPIGAPAPPTSAPPDCSSLPQ